MIFEVPYCVAEIGHLLSRFSPGFPQLLDAPFSHFHLGLDIALRLIDCFGGGASSLEAGLPRNDDQQHDERPNGANEHREERKHRKPRRRTPPDPSS